MAWTVDADDTWKGLWRRPRQSFSFHLFSGGECLRRRGKGRQGKGKGKKNKSEEERKPLCRWHEIVILVSGFSITTWRERRRVHAKPAKWYDLMACTCSISMCSVQCAGMVVHYVFLHFTCDSTRHPAPGAPERC